MYVHKEIHVLAVTNPYLNTIFLCILVKFLERLHYKKKMEGIFYWFVLGVWFVVFFKGDMTAFNKLKLLKQSFSTSLKI